MHQKVLLKPTELIWLRWRIYEKLTQLFEGRKKLEEPFKFLAEEQKITPFLCENQESGKRPLLNE
jgi:hypothetical protein